MNLWLPREVVRRHDKPERPVGEFRRRLDMIGGGWNGREITLSEQARAALRRWVETGRCGE